VVGRPTAVLKADKGQPPRVPSLLGGTGAPRHGEDQGRFGAIVSVMTHVRGVRQVWRPLLHESFRNAGGCGNGGRNWCVTRVTCLRPAPTVCRQIFTKFRR